MLLRVSTRYMLYVMHIQALECIIKLCVYLNCPNFTLQNSLPDQERTDTKPQQMSETSSLPFLGKSGRLFQACVDGQNLPFIFQFL
jgi:hypothetical protein